MRGKRIATGAVCLLLVVGAAIAWTAGYSICKEVAGVGTVSVDVSRLARGMASTFCYLDDGGRQLRFVLARGADGKLRSVFDACRQCFIYHRGFAVADGHLVCRVCGNRYSIEHVHEGKASCVPVNLPHQEYAGTVQIKTSDLASGHSLF
ncbi:MAG: Fe-S-containing protein [Candidatus Binataceae bacterium]